MGTPIPDAEPVKAVVKRKGGKWYAVLCYQVTLPEQPDNGVSAGIDRNCGQYAYTTSAGEQGFLRHTETKHNKELQKRREIKLKRYKCKLARQQKGSGRRARTKKKVGKWSRRIANARKNANHRASKTMAAKASTVYIEELKTAKMTRSAKGTVDKPGKNVKQKAGLNREILGTGWAQFEQMLQYKCREVVKVPAA